MFGIEVDQLKDASTPEEMRAELNRLRRLDPLVCSVFDSADYNGMSAEDRFTVLSYHAMKERSELKQKIAEYMLNSNAPTLLKV